MSQSPALAPLDERQRRRHKLRNSVQTVLLLAGLTLLLAACGWLLAGPEGLMWVVISAALFLVLSPRISPRLVLSMYRAQPIPRHVIPELHDVLEAITRRTDLPRIPRLYYIPSSMLSAFAVGNRDDAVIGVTDGVLRLLTLRELAGVFAHEISHIRNRDLWVMGLADTISQVTRIMAITGTVLLIVTLPMWLAEYGTVPWLAILLLAVAPTIGSLLQLALSRAREFDADLDAAGLTGDPVGLASALEKMERYQGGFWEKILMPGRRLPDPSLLRTHPPTEERIRRLLSLRPDAPAVSFGSDGTIAVPGLFPPVDGRPRRRVTGLWY